MLRSRKLKVMLSIFLVFSVVIFTIWYVLSFSVKTVEQEEQVLGEESISAVPYIVSISPVSVSPGEEYEYSLKVSDVDTEDKFLYLEYVEGPAWLMLSGRVLKGIAPLDSQGTYKIVLRVSDGENFSVQESYILVEEGNEY